MSAPEQASAAEVLRYIADALDAGVPVPESIGNVGAGRVELQFAGHRDHSTEQVDAWAAHLGAVAQLGRTFGQDTKPWREYEVKAPWQGQNLHVWTSVDVPPAATAPPAEMVENVPVEVEVTRASVGEVILPGDLSSYVVSLTSAEPERAPRVELAHLELGTTPAGPVRSLRVEDAAHLARLLDLGVRMASETRPDVADNRVIAEVAAALRTLGAVSRTNADALLGLCVVELTDRERAAVLGTFAVEGGELR